MFIVISNQFEEILDNGSFDKNDRAAADFFLEPATRSKIDKI